MARILHRPALKRYNDAELAAELVSRGWKIEGDFTIANTASPDIDIKAMTVEEFLDYLYIKHDVPISVGWIKYEALALMLAAWPKSVRTAKLVSIIYDAMPYADQPKNPAGNIKTHICQLRQKLEPTGWKIGVLRGVGYRLVAPFSIKELEETLSLST